MKAALSKSVSVSWATVVLSLVAGALAVLNQTTFDFGGQWHQVVTVSLVFLAGLGITPLTGAAFKNALHLPHAAAVIITGVFVAMQAVQLDISMSPAVHAVLAGVIVILAGLGFGTGTSTVASKSS